MSVAVGDKVKCSAEYDWNGTHLASFVRVNTYDVIRIGGFGYSNERIVIGIGTAVTAAVHIKYLTNISNPAKPTVTPAAKPKVVEKISGGSDKLADKILNSIVGGSMTEYTISKLSGSSVQFTTDRIDPTASADFQYTINKILANKYKSLLSPAENRALDRSDPSKVQNASKFPAVKFFDNSVGYYRYNYYMDYEGDKLANGKPANSDMGAVKKSINLDIVDRYKLFDLYSSRYNKFKIPNPNDRLAKTFAHVFFVRPDCNIYAEGSSGGSLDPKLQSGLDILSEFYYANKHCPQILRQLTQAEADYDNQFMMFLSNKARSFEISDEYIGSDTYGQGLTGYKIPYGKDNVESRTSGKFSINYIDDRDLHIYNLHKLWIDYISYVYRGKVYPKDQYILNKVLDYSTCVYYIVCAEDGESVIFWSKYWGVFPVEAPSSGFSFNIENNGTMRDPDLKIEYNYAWKEDFNPLSLIEFNEHGNKSKLNYIHSYQETKAGTGYTWAGAPFIETFDGTENLPYTFKLKFRPQ